MRTSSFNFLASELAEDSTTNEELIEAIRQAILDTQ